MGKKTGKKTRITAIALALTIIMTLGGTAALMMANPDVATSEGNGVVAIDINETTSNTFKILPGTTQEKDPTVTLQSKDGATTDTGVYAYVIVHEEDNWYFTPQLTTGKIINWEIADGWTALKKYPASTDFVLDPEGANITVKAGDRVYWREVSADEAAKASFPVLKENQVRYASSLRSSDIDGKTPKLAFQAYAIQKAPFNNPLMAWKQRLPQLPNKGDIIKIDNEEYRVLSLDGAEAFVMSMHDVSEDKNGMNYADYKTFGPSIFYMNSNIDYYLENVWYSKLDSTMHDAIKSDNIMQDEYSINKTRQAQSRYYKETVGFEDPITYYIGKYRTEENIGERHVYLLGIGDVIDYLGTNKITPEDVNNMFFGTTEKDDNYCWLRSTYGSCDEFCCVIGKYGSIGYDNYSVVDEIRAAFTIDLSEVDFEVCPPAPIEPLENMPKKGDIIEIEGIDGTFRVLYAGTNRVFVMSMNDVSKNEEGTPYGNEGGEEKKDYYTVKKYIGSNIDNYLENEWYKDLKPEIKNKIVSSKVNQGVYSFSWSDNYYYRDTYTGVIGFENPTKFSITNAYGPPVDGKKRHVYLIDIKDAIDYLGEGNITPENVNKMFFNTEKSVDRLCWLRSAGAGGVNDLYCVNGKHGSMCGWDGYSFPHEARAAFTIILDGVNFKIVE